MSGDLRDQIYDQMNLRETDELLDIWVTNDRLEWADTAFETIRAILIKRGVELPGQNDPIYEREEEIEDEADSRDGLEDWEVKVLDNDDQPDFYDTIEVLNLRRMLNRTATAAIVVYAILALFNGPLASILMIGAIPSFQQITGALALILLYLLGYGLQILITFYGLRALGSILRILMEMEFNSRRS